MDPVTRKSVTMGGDGLRISCRTIAATAWLVAGPQAGAHAADVAAWGSSIAALAHPLPANVTIRQFARPSVGGSRVRVTFSNATGTAPLSVSDARLALAGAEPGSIDVTTDHAVAFGGRASVTIPLGSSLTSDPVDMSLRPLARVAVSATFASKGNAQVGHFLASETNVLGPPGHASDAVIPGSLATPSGYYLDGISVTTEDPAATAIVCLGDSITDGQGSSPDAERRYPDILAERLLAAGGRVGVVDAGISGNRLVSEDGDPGVGATGSTRLDRDALSRPGVRWVILLEGINDILHAPDGVDVAADLIAGYRQVVARAHVAGVSVYGGTLTPFGRESLPSSFASREAMRMRVNAWIRTSGVFDGVIDFDVALRDPGAPDRMLPALDSGDHLHPSDAGYAAMARAVPITEFHGSRGP